MVCFSMYLFCSSRALYADASTKEDDTGTAIFIALSTFFVVVILGSAYEVYRSDRQFRRRQEQETDASIKRSKEQAAKMQGGVTFQTVSICHHISHPVNAIFFHEIT